MTRNHPDYLATSCPLCKKTFAKAQEPVGTETLDIAELVAMAIDDHSYADMENSHMISATGVIA